MEVDTREAQKAGLLRPLVRREIELHMADFGSFHLLFGYFFLNTLLTFLQFELFFFLSLIGLEPEFVTHNTMVSTSITL